MFRRQFNLSIWRMKDPALRIQAFPMVLINQQLLIYSDKRWGVHSIPDLRFIFFSDSVGSVEQTFEPGLITCLPGSLDKLSQFQVSLLMPGLAT